MLLLRTRQGVNTIAVSPNNETLVVAGQDRLIRVYDLQGPLQVSESNRYSSTTTPRTTACSLLGSSLRHRTALIGLAGWSVARLMGVCCSSRCAQFMEDSSFRLAVLPTEPEAGHSDRIVRAAFAHDSLHLLTCSFDKTVMLWDTRRGHGKRPLKVFRGREGGRAA